MNSCNCVHFVRIRHGHLGPLKGCPRGVKRWTAESEYASSYSSRAITFTFGQIPLGKV